MEFARNAKQHKEQYSSSSSYSRSSSSSSSSSSAARPAYDPEKDKEVQFWKKKIAALVDFDPTKQTSRGSARAAVVQSRRNSGTATASSSQHR